MSEARDKLRDALDCHVHRFQDGAAKAIVGAYAIEYLPALLAETEWRDISTAPRDGTFVLGWYGARAMVVRFNEFGYWTTLEHTHAGEPRLWMPLPAPPEPKP